ncbi:MAG: HAD-IC family P-type ATPase [Burkholderiales bacterium]
MSSTPPSTESSPAPDDLPFHARPVDEVLRHLDSGHHGLTHEAAAERLARHGPNRLETRPPAGLLKRFALQFHNVLVYVLLVSATIVLLLGHVVDALVIIGVTVINAVIGVIQEGRAEQALAAIRDMLAPTASVIRSGQRLTVGAAMLVPGAVVHIEAGDRVPADARLVESHGLSVDEAALTGESVPVAKHPDPVAREAVLAERTSMVHAGTLVTRGQSRAVIVATGARSEIGRVTGLVANVEALETPLTRKLASFGSRLTCVIGALSIAVLAVGWRRGLDVGETFLAVVGLAVAAIPEGLPAILTIALAIGVRRMAARNAIVRRLPSVETLGSVTIICTDKTGTLTRNEMSVARAFTTAGAFRIQGAGYAPVGRVIDEVTGDVVRGSSALDALARAACLCNDAQLAEIDGSEWVVAGDPMEGALLAFAGRTGADSDGLRRLHPRTGVVPFDARDRLMITVHRPAEGRAVALLKGAPEAVLARCDADAQTEAHWARQTRILAAEGMRVLALAEQVFDEGATGDPDLAHGFRLLGLVGLIDPPREEAIAAVAQCHAAGIRVKMITGDHPATARAIAAQIGLSPERVLEGRDLQTRSPAELAGLVLETDVFSRASPEDKLVIVEALQAQGQVVSMTGDGVNDAPALKRADVGVAMGRKGTEAAKEAAAVVLADDNFASIAHAVEEGRTVYDNVRKAILYILPTNGAEAAAMVLAILLALPLPISAVQILWVNMVTEVTLSIVIAFDPTEPGVMRRRPRDPAEPLLSRFLAWRTLLVVAIVTACLMGMFDWTLDRTGSEAAARTAAVNTLVAAEIFYLFNMRFIDASSMTREAWFGNAFALPAVAILCVMQAMFTYVPVMQNLFGTASLDAAAWIGSVASGLALFGIVEIEKGLRRGARHRSG